MVARITGSILTDDTDALMFLDLLLFLWFLWELPTFHQVHPIATDSFEELHAHRTILSP